MTVLKDFGRMVICCARVSNHHPTPTNRMLYHQAAMLAITGQTNEANVQREVRDRSEVKGQRGVNDLRADQKRIT